MVQSVSGNYSAAVIAQDQQIQHKVLVGFPGSVPAVQQDVTDNVISIVPRRNATTAVNDAISGIAGLATAELVITLAGMLPQAAGMPKLEADTVERLFRPNDPASAMYRTTRTGLTVTVQIGYPQASPGEWVTIYTGVVDIPLVGDGIVTLTCRDPNDTLNGAASLPPVITQTPANSGLTSEFAFDYLARHNTPVAYLTWPAQHPNCVLSVGMRSSIYPEVGSLEPVYAQNPTFVPGPYGTGLGSGGVPLAFTPSTPMLTTDKNCGHFLSGGDALIELTQPVSLYYLVVWRLGANLLVFTISPSGQSIAASTPISAGLREIEFSLSWAASSTAFSGTVWIDGVPHSMSGTALDARPVGYSWTRIVAGGNVGGLAGVQITTEPSYTSRYPFVPTLFLDPSLSNLNALPDVTGKKVKDVFQDMAGAEGGVFVFDELGVPRFYNRNTIRTKTPGRTVTSKLSLLGLSTQEQRGYTHIQVPYTPLAIQAFQTVWNAATVLQVNTGATITINASTANSIVGLGTSIVTWSGVAVAGTSAYRAARNKDGSGGAISNLIMTVTQTGPKLIQITVRNPNGFPVYLCSPQGTLYPDASDGQPALMVNAQPVSADSTIPDTTTSVAGGAYADAQWPPLSDGGAITNATFGDRLYPAPSSDWRQDPDTAQAMANDLLSDLHYPKVMYRNVSMVFDPTLQLLDAVTLVDTDSSQTNEAVLLLGIYPQLSAGEWSMAVDALALYRPGAWELGVSTLGVDNYLYS